MPELIEQTVYIGQDTYGRRVTMKRYKKDGRSMWSITSDPASQRDDGERMDGLTDDNVGQMFQAVDVVKRNKGPST